MPAEVQIRPLQESDREEWITTMLDGYNLDPQFQWRCPRRKEYPEDARRGTGGLFDEAMNTPGIHPFVAVTPNEKGEWVVAALTTWQWKNSDNFEISGFDSPDQRRDIDPKRQKAFIDALSRAERKYFGPEWGRKRLELVDVVTAPKYHRQGFGRALMKWGLEEASKENTPVTLTASPLGKLLYGSLGFRELGRVDCEVIGDDGKSEWTYAMIWTPEGWEKPQS